MVTITERGGLNRSRVRAFQLTGVGILVGVVIGSVLSFVVFPHQQAHATPPSVVTRGDAEVIFNAAYTGCGAIMAQGNLHEGQPCEDWLRAQLRLFADLPTQHYCVDDWHVDRITDVETSRESAPAFDATFTIDGQPLATQRTPVKPVNPNNQAAFVAQFGPGTYYWVNVGTILPPSALGVGIHTSHFEAFAPSGTQTFDRTFEIVAIGTGACLLS